MKIKKFYKLPAKTQLVMISSIAARNAIENVHAKYIPDSEMTKVNQTIRKHIMEVIDAIFNPEKGSNMETLQYWIASIPDYWELPE